LAAAGAGRTHKNIGAGRIYKNMGAYKNLGVDKTLAHEKLGVSKMYVSTKHRRPQMLAQEKVGGDAEELPYCWARQNPQQLTSLRPR
jgi:hypothetical protein